MHADLASSETPRISCPLCAQSTATLFYTETRSVPWHLYAPEADRSAGLRFFRCELCALIYKDPAIRPTPEQARSHYIKHNNDPQEPGYRAHLAALLDPVAARVPPGASGLDYGSGPTLSLEPLAHELGLRCISFDPLFAGRPELLIDGGYDFVLCCEVVEHFTDPRAEFVRLARLIGPTGILAIKTLLVPEAFADWWYQRDPTHVCFFSQRTFQAVAELTGLAVVWQCGGTVLFQRSAE